MSASTDGKDFKVAFDDAALLDNSEAQYDLDHGQTTVGPSQPKKFDRTITTIEEDAKARAKEGALSNKMGTLEGVFVPTTLNVLSILMFVRFSFIIGQAGILGTFALLCLSLTINLLTTLSISAISTNGTVRGGGAYYMISRSLGPEFGGSIGIVFYVGQVLNSGMNVVAFFDVLLGNFGSVTGKHSKIIPESSGLETVYSTLLLALCTVACTKGSSIFSKAGNVLFVILIISIFSIPVSLAFVKPYLDSRFEAWYTGFRWATLTSNFMPKFTAGAAGSDRKGVEDFQDMFSILFPATAGIFAGAGMSGDLKAPSRSIPKGTLYSLLCTFFLYSIVIISIGGAVSRELLHKDIQVIENMNISDYIVLVGELSTSCYSVLVGVIGSAKLLQAIARDNLLPVFNPFASGHGDDDSPFAALAFTFALTWVTLFLNVNQIAMFVTMAFLMTFVVTNVACFLLKLASAPNFRPSFKYFSHWTAGSGAVACLVSMFISDGPSASGMVFLLTVLFIILHYLSPPKAWGDVSQGLIYHQVRKYLLRLKQDHVKYWRPQILVLVDDPKRSWNLIHFCNHLKKGGLYILGHVVVTDNFHESFPEVTRQQEAWTKLRDISHVKGFVQIAASSDVVWGARNVYLGSGLGGMRPNITVMGFYKGNEGVADDSLALDIEQLPTDSCRKEPSVTPMQWVNIIEDLITMHGNIAIAKGFSKMEFVSPDCAARPGDGAFIDLYPIQMSAHIKPSDGESAEESSARSLWTTNFDTYTLVLQLGAILQTTTAWKSRKLRVIAFVETHHRVHKETVKIEALLAKLRISAQVKVICLQECPAYRVVLRGKQDVDGKVTEQIRDDPWWTQLQQVRAEYDNDIPEDALASLSNHDSTVLNSKDWDNVLSRREQWYNHSQLHRLGVNLNMQTNALSNKAFNVSGTNTPDTPSRALSRVESLSDESRPLLLSERPTVSYSGTSTTAGGTPRPALSFNDVPARIQHVILNDLMKNMSNDAAVIFTTLPAPSFGTYTSREDSEAYITSLETWCRDLPPMMLLHSQSLTVTTAL